MAKESLGHAPPVLQQELGTLEVHDGVFCSLAARAIAGVAGVAAVGRAASGLFRLGSRPDVVHVERGQGEVAFSVHLTVRYEVCIPEMMVELRGALTEAIEPTTGYKVRAINATVDHILAPLPPLPTKDDAAGDAPAEVPPIPEPE
jgi:uncharacterized alkaline shock family protein YloU